MTPMLAYRLAMHNLRAGVEPHMRLPTYEVQPMRHSVNLATTQWRPWRSVRHAQCFAATRKPRRYYSMAKGLETYRPPVMGATHMVSSGHYLAAAAGYRILEQGGNAIDAGVASGIAINVTLRRWPRGI